MAEQISCIIHTSNSQATIEAALASVTWAAEILVVDMESNDGTLDIARKYTDRIFTAARVKRVDGIRNQYIALAEHPWILVLDSDEYLAADAQEAVRRLIREYGDQYDAFALPRYNYIAGQFMRGSLWYPDQQTRLFRKGMVRWPDGTHIKPTVLSNRLLVLTPPNCLHIHHRNYESLTHFLTKQLTYALNDQYDSDPEQFRFDDYVAKAWHHLESRKDPENDGDLSRALAMSLAWDAIVRGLIHWDRLEPRPPLPDVTALPGTPLRPNGLVAVILHRIRRRCEQWRRRR